MADFTVLGTMREDYMISLMDSHKMGRLLKGFIGKDLEIAIKPYRKQRTNQQNRWLWGVAYMDIQAFLKDTTGETISKEAIHAHTLQYVLNYTLEMEEVGGQDVLVVQGKSTSKLNTVEFVELKEDLQAHWGERGCEIRDPKGSNLLNEFLKDD